MAITMLCSLMVVNASAGNVYETNLFSIELELDGEWEVDQGTEAGYCYDYYGFISKNDRTAMEIIIFEDPTMELFDDLSSNSMGGENHIATETTIDGAKAICATGQYDDTDNEYAYLDYIANIHKNGYTYRIEMGTNPITNDNAASGNESEQTKAQYDSIVNSIMEMKLFKKSAPTESDKEDASNSNNEEKTESDISDNTVIIVAVVVGGVVILGVTAMIIFGKKKKQ